MRNNILIRLLMVTALLILAIPVVASAQIYNRDRYDNYSERAIRDAMNRLDSAGARLERDVNVGRGRRVLGVFWIERTDNNALADIRDFRSAVRQLRNRSNNGRALGRSRDEAALVLDRGVQLDRHLRLRTGRTDVDADLSELRSNLHIVADAYGLSMPY